MGRRHQSIKTWKKRARAARGVLGAVPSSRRFTGKRQVDALAETEEGLNSTKKERMFASVNGSTFSKLVVADDQPCQVQ